MHVFDYFTTFTDCILGRLPKTLLQHFQRFCSRDSIGNFKQTRFSINFSMVKIDRQTFRVVNKQLPNPHDLCHFYVFLFKWCIKFTLYDWCVKEPSSFFEKFCIFIFQITMAGFENFLLLWMLLCIYTCILKKMKQKKIFFLKFV